MIWIIRNNLLTRKNYTPYCGSPDCRNMPRTFFNGEQMECPDCSWQSSFEPELIEEYKAKQLELENSNGESAEDS